MSKVAVGIGSSLGDRVKLVERAVAALSEVRDTKVVSVSDLYETKAWGAVAEKDFINACVMVETQLTPPELLRELLAIEERFGRERTEKWSDRTLDLDLLLFNDVICAKPECMIPHPDMHRRAFVLIPLMQIAPDLPHPIRGLTVSELAHTLPSVEWATVKRFGPCQANETNH